MKRLRGDEQELLWPGHPRQPVLGGAHRWPSVARIGRFNINADIAKGLVEFAAKYCPEAILGIVVNPVNSVVRAKSELYTKKDLDPFRVVGLQSSL